MWFIWYIIIFIRLWRHVRFSTLCYNQCNKQDGSCKRELYNNTKFATQFLSTVTTSMVVVIVMIFLLSDTSKSINVEENKLYFIQVFEMNRILYYITRCLKIFNNIIYYRFFCQRWCMSVKIGNGSKRFVHMCKFKEDDQSERSRTRYDHIKICDV